MVTEEELQKQGYRKIRGNYNGNCNWCKKPFEAGEEIYWKRNQDQATTVCCPRCYGASNKIKAVCPNCGTEFYVSQ